jgi:hypothetical protein
MKQFTLHVSTRKAKRYRGGEGMKARALLNRLDKGVNMCKSIAVKYVGIQQDDIHGDFPLYNLLEPMGEHPVYSTVSLATIWKHGCYPFVVGNESEKFLP